ncbi:hypothetical protein IWW47_004264 [Coemansia sp. RSA 2052]|nr:hypothetical protein IWW47_004264 [Coemansia sp. RSA 2052]
MKPAKSGNSSPYSPGRRKSVVEMSSTISPRDLEEWMQWQGDSAILDRRTPSEPAGARDDTGYQVSMASPSMPKGAGMTLTVDDEDGNDGDSSDDDALQMQRSQDIGAWDSFGRRLDESAAKQGIAYDETVGTEDADIESECGSCFDSVEYAELVESNKSLSAASSSPVNTALDETVVSQSSVDPPQEPAVPI